MLLRQLMLDRVVVSMLFAVKMATLQANMQLQLCVRNGPYSSLFSLRASNKNDVAGIMLWDMKMSTTCGKTIS